LKIIIFYILFYHSFRIFDKITLFLFIPGCYTYILTNLYKPQPKKINLFHLRFWLARFTSYINPSGKSRHRIVRKHKTETKHQISLYMSLERTAEIEENIRNHFSRNKPFLKHGYSLRMLSGRKRYFLSKNHFKLRSINIFLN
jgi:hypothetical protein